MAQNNDMQIMTDAMKVMEYVDVDKTQSLGPEEFFAAVVCLNLKLGGACPA